MERHYDKEIQEMRGLIRQMSEQVAMSLEEAMNGLTKADLGYFKKVYEREVEVNRQHLLIDQKSVELLARRSPLASQLRLMIGIIRINQELESIADQVVNVCRSADIYLQRPPLKPLIDIPRMANEVLGMLRQAVDCFMKEDLAGCFQVISKDDIVDALHVQILRELFTYIGGNAQNLEQAMGLIFISKNLERMADHVSAIAEHAIFCISGQDVRHVYDRKMPQKKITLLFLCVHNSARSQMAEGLARKILGDKVNALSAGTEPTSVNPFAVHVMREVGVDISGYKAKSVGSVDWQNIDFVVTLTDQEVAPAVLLRSAKRLHWDVEDPEETFESFRRVRDKLVAHIEEFKSIFVPS